MLDPNYLANSDTPSTELKNWLRWVDIRIATLKNVGDIKSEDHIARGLLEKAERDRELYVAALRFRGDFDT